MIDAHYTAMPAMTDAGADTSDDDGGYWTGSVPPPDDEDNLVGATLSNTYKVIRVLGEGGMGRVYEAQHTRINSKRFALKALHPEFARRKDVLARFQREVEAAASINSSHVVGVYDVDQTDDGRPFLVSELLEGKELGQYLDDSGRISVGFAVGIIRQICRALIAAHAMGVVHRDMKPENVFLSGDVHDPLVKVLDFGISRLEGQGGNTLTKTGFIMGTPSYMAPEQAKGERVDHRADIYSVGAIMYQAVTGKVPFDRSDATATLAAVLTEEPERPRAIAPDIPEHIEMIIQTAMARTPDDRYQSMAEFDAALSPYDEADMMVDEPSQSMRLRIPSRSLVDATDQAREVADARPQFLVLGTIIIAGGLFGLTTAISGAMRLARGGAGATITGTEALVMLLILVAALSTPFGLLIRHVKRNIWANTAKVLELVRSLREPVIMAMTAYGVLALTLRMLEGVALRTPVGIGWAGWDVLLPIVAATVGGVLFAAKRGAKGAALANPSFVERMGTAVAVALAAGIVAVILLVATVMRDASSTGWGTVAPTPDAPAGETASESAPGETATDETDSDTTPAPRETSMPLAGDDAFKQWDKVLAAVKVGNTKGAVNELALLVELDANAARDGNVRKGVLDLSIRACLLNDATCDKMLELMTNKMGQRGIDMFYEIFTTRGGTNAWKRADRILKDPAMRNKGSQGMRVAYDLRLAQGCDAKKAMFSRVKAEGDHRALRELEILKSSRQCRAVRCCLQNDDDLNETVRALIDKPK